MQVGYARVSSAGQSLEIQREQLTAAGCKPIYEEKRSGRTAEDRPALRKALEFVREADTLVVTRIDRLARSLLDLETIVKGLAEKGVHLKALEQPVDTSTPAGKAFLQMLGVFAEFELALRKERQLEGIAKAKEKGVYRGRKPSIDPAAVKAALDAGETPTAVARRLGLARSSVYRVKDAAASW